MKKLIVLILALAALVSCDYGDRLDNLENRVSTLEEMCAQMNQDISSIQEIVKALQNNDFVTGVEPVVYEGKEVGYIINFSKSGSVTIYNGKDGKDGQNGKDGQDGQNGKDGQDGINGQDGKDGVDGKDGHTPVVGAKLDEDGQYYWTVDGEWLLNDDGKKIPVTGEDGNTPELKIVDDYWFITYNDGKTWEKLGKATGEDGDSFFKDVTVSENEVIIVLADGETIVLPINNKIVDVEFNIENDETGVFAGKEICIKYTIKNATETTKISASSDGFYAVKVQRDSIDRGSIFVVCPEPYQDGFINVIVADNGYSTLRIINFYENHISFPKGLDYHVDAEGGQVQIPVVFNFNYKLVVDEAAESWISLPGVTKAPEMQNEVINIAVSANDKYESREGMVFIYSDILPDKPYQIITIRQEKKLLPIEKDMIFKVVANSENLQTVELPLWGDIECEINWGDGKIEQYKQVNNKDDYKFISHEYEKAAQYDVRIVGKVASLRSFIPKTEIKIAHPSILEVVQWGETGLEDISYGFYNNTILQKIALPNPKSFKNIDEFSSTFAGCAGLTVIPDYFFQYCNAGIAFNETFKDCKALKAIPEDLFMDCENAADFTNVFAGCEGLTNIPESLFRYNPNVVTFKGAFNGCKNIKEIPENLFANCINVIDFNSVFANCELLQNIPESLFVKSTKVTDFDLAFSNCKSLVNIPELLFDKNNNVITFNGVFQDCSSLTEIPENIFVNTLSVVDFSNVFSGCEALTAVPEFVFARNIEVTTFEGAFKNCKVLEEIPDSLFINAVNVSNYHSAFEGCAAVKEIPDSLFLTSTGVMDFISVFKSCTSLDSIPHSLFVNCPNVITFHSAFAECTNLKKVPENIFDANKKVENFDYTFMNCINLESESPYTIVNEEKYHLYERQNVPEIFPVVPRGIGCFKGCEKLADFKSIPDTWK